jgi:peptidoglycan hydrolase-like protein with peptidoglycan-binding domain
VQQIGNTSPTWWKPVMRVLLVSALWFVSACTAPHRSSSPPSMPTQRSERPAPDRLLTRGDTQVAEAHVQDIGCDSGPVDGSFTAQTQAAVRAF